jgi:hypothetical protein
VNRYVTALLLALIFQGLITAAVFWPRHTAGPGETRPPLALHETALVREITISDEFDNRVLLQRTDSGWVLPYLNGLPADEEKVKALLQALDQGSAGWPVADSAAARQRFQVADYLYQRRIDLAWDEHPGTTVFLGTAPGFRKVHARNHEQRAIYSIAFNSFDAPSTSSAWLRPSLLQVRTPLAVVGDGYSLRREGDGWISGSGKVPEERELERLLNALRNLHIEGVADADLQRQLSAAEADIALQVIALGGEISLELFTVGERHYIQSSEYPYFFTLGAWGYERLATVDLGLIGGEGPLSP